MIYSPGFKTIQLLIESSLERPSMLTAYCLHDKTSFSKQSISIPHSTRERLCEPIC